MGGWLLGCCWLFNGFWWKWWFGCIPSSVFGLVQPCRVLFFLRKTSLLQKNMIFDDFQSLFLILPLDVFCSQVPLGRGRLPMPLVSCNGGRPCGGASRFASREASRFRTSARFPACSGIVMVEGGLVLWFLLIFNWFSWKLGIRSPNPNQERCGNTPRDFCQRFRNKCQWMTRSKPIIPQGSPETKFSIIIWFDMV